MKNAIIETAKITNDDYGILTIYIMVKYHAGGQGFGGYALYSPNLDRDLTGLFIWRVLEIAGVHSWDELPGKTIRVKGTFHKIQSIGHMLDDNLWFEPEKEFGG